MKFRGETDSKLLADKASVAAGMFRNKINISPGCINRPDSFQFNEM
jgi:hypothetical protein